MFSRIITPRTRRHTLWAENGRKAGEAHLPCVETLVHQLQPVHKSGTPNLSEITGIGNKKYGKSVLEYVSSKWLEHAWRSGHKHRRPG